jgi:preprotein translocase subunit SecB
MKAVSLMLEPIDFAQLYLQQAEAQAGTAQPNTPETGHA